MSDETQEAPQFLSLADSEETFTVTDAEIGLIGGSPSIRYVLRPITKAQSDALRHKHRGKKEWNRHARAFEYPEFNQAGYDADMLDLALVDWSGVFLRGVPAPCTRENKLRLDPLRQPLLVTKATMNRVNDAAPEEDAEADSFRTPESV